DSQEGDGDRQRDGEPPTIRRGGMVVAVRMVMPGVREVGHRRPAKAIPPYMSISDAVSNDARTLATGGSMGYVKPGRKEPPCPEPSAFMTSPGWMPPDEMRCWRAPSQTSGLLSTRCDRSWRRCGSRATWRCPASP